MTVSVDAIISPETVKVLPNEGMPLVKENEDSTLNQSFGPSGTGVERGDLHVSFDLVFPKHVPAEHKAALRRILS